jgi:enoyl-CoA hydratase/carnithine racemase
MTSVKMMRSKLLFLKSGGEKAFCAGASFDELISIKDFETGKTFFSGFANVINAMRKSSKLIIARIHGRLLVAELELRVRRIIHLQRKTLRLS